MNTPASFSNINWIEVIVFIFHSTIAAGFIVFLYKKFHGVDDVSLKKTDRKYEEFEKNKNIISSLQSGANVNNLIKLTAYEILFKKDVSRIDIDALDIIIKMKNPKKALRIYEKCFSFLTIENSKFKKSKSSKEPKYKLWGGIYLVMGICIILSIVLLPYTFDKYLDIATSPIYRAVIIESLTLVVCIPFFYISAYSLNRLSIKTELNWITQANSYNG